MGILKTLWGLLVDDVRLALVLGSALILAFGLRQAGLSLVAAVVLWIGLLGALWFSIEHQLKLRQVQEQSKRQ